MQSPTIAVSAFDEVYSTVSTTRAFPFCWVSSCGNSTSRTPTIEPVAFCPCNLHTIFLLDVENTEILAAIECSDCRTKDTTRASIPPGFLAIPAHQTSTTTAQSNPRQINQIKGMRRLQCVWFLGLITKININHHF